MRPNALRKSAFYAGARRILFGKLSRVLPTTRPLQRLVFCLRVQIKLTPATLTTRTIRPKRASTAVLLGKLGLDGPGSLGHAYPKHRMTGFARRTTQTLLLPVDLEGRQVKTAFLSRLTTVVFGDRTQELDPIVGLAAHQVGRLG